MLVVTGAIRANPSLSNHCGRVCDTGNWFSPHMKVIILVCNKNQLKQEKTTMKKLTKYLSSACLMLAGYASVNAVAADASSTSAYAREAAEKARACHRAAHDSRKAGQYDTRLADECVVACRAASALYKRQEADRKHQQVQMERCTQHYNTFKSPDKAPVAKAKLPQITQMPSTVEEMISRMSAMKRDGRTNRDPCRDGAKTIRQRQFDLEQSKFLWNRCVQQYNMDMKMKSISGS